MDVYVISSLLLLICSSARLELLHGNLEMKAQGCSCFKVLNVFSRLINNRNVYLLYKLE